MLVSIIVPIYNARKYLRRTAGDLLRQTYREIEVIFVDDGSTDGSGKTLDRIARKDERVRVLHQRNGGTACARNAGMAAASGDYLMFMDDDDRIPEGHVKEYADAIEKTGADIVIGGYRRISPDGRILFTRTLVRPPCRMVEIRTPSGAKKSVSGWLGYINISPWAKIYRRSFVEKSGAQFLEYPYGEDIYFQMMLHSAHPVTVCTGSVSYGWVNHKESISNTIHKGIREEADMFPMLDKVLEVHPERDDLFRYFLYRHCAYHLCVSGRDAGSKRLVAEFKRCRDWLQKNELALPFSPFSPRLKGEILRDRVAVFVICMTSRLHLERLFARIYCRGTEGKKT